jgi:hypothetical protein
MYERMHAYLKYWRRNAGYQQQAANLIEEEPKLVRAVALYERRNCMQRLGSCL